MGFNGIHSHIEMTVIRLYMHLKQKQDLHTCAHDRANPANSNAQRIKPFIKNQSAFTDCRPRNDFIFNTEGEKHQFIQQKSKDFTRNLKKRLTARLSAGIKVQACKLMKSITTCQLSSSLKHQNKIHPV